MINSTVIAIDPSDLGKLKIACKTNNYAVVKSLYKEKKLTGDDLYNEIDELMDIAYNNSAGQVVDYLIKLCLKLGVHKTKECE